MLSSAKLQRKRFNERRLYNTAFQTEAVQFLGFHRFSLHAGHSKAYILQELCARCVHLLQQYDF
jgi:hypothetical protein